MTFETMVIPMRFERAESLVHLALTMQSSYMGITLDDIQDEFSVSRRTAERMRDSVLRVFPSAEEVRVDGRQKRWRMPRRGGLKLIDVSAEDLATLEFAKTIFDREGLDQHARRISAINLKVRSIIEDRRLTSIDVDVEALLEAEGLAMRSGPRPRIENRVLGDLRAAILKCEKVVIHYKARGTGKVSRQRVCPYGFLYGNRHYLIAYSTNPKVKDYRLYVLSNILRVEFLGEAYSRRDDFSLQDYAEKSFGVFQGNLHDIVLKFSPAVASDAGDYIFHPTQKSAGEKDGSLVVKFTASSLREIAWHLFTWGTEVKVIEPKRLKKMMEPIQKALRNTSEWKTTDE